MSMCWWLRVAGGGRSGATGRADVEVVLPASRRSRARRHAFVLGGLVEG
jgi:hypothetical protein